MTVIATWNVNSVKARLPHLLRWLREAQPDIVLLQELKVVEAAFPGLEIGDLGYNWAMVGQPSYNGVAILSKTPIDVIATALPGEESDAHARYIEGFTGSVRVASIYLPNGNPIGTPKFTYKLAWLDRLYRHVQDLLMSDDTFVLGGDYNVAPEDRDVYDPAALAGDALCQPETRAAFRKILHLGLTDAIGALGDGTPRFTWWDYQRRAFAGDQGMRIDHLLLSPQAADRLEAADVDREPRGWDRPSDHAPVWVRLTPLH